MNRAELTTVPRRKRKNAKRQRRRKVQRERRKQHKADDMLYNEARILPETCAGIVLGKTKLNEPLLGINGGSALLFPRCVIS